MAVFEVSLTDGVSGPAAKAGGAVDSLIKDFESLQKSMAAEKSAVTSALSKEIAQNRSIAAEQSKNLGGYDSARDAAAAKQSAQILAEQKANLAAYADAATAAYGRAAQAAEALNARQTDLLKEQQDNLSAYAQAADAMAGRASATLASVAAEQQKNLAAYAQNAEVSQALKEQGEAAQETSKWFADLSQNADATTESAAGLIAAWEKYGGIVQAVGQAVGFLAGKLFDAAAMAVKLSQEKDQLKSVLDVFTGGPKATGELLDSLNDLATRLPFTSGQMAGWAKNLLAAGISGDVLIGRVEAIGSAVAIMGSAGGSAAETLFKRLQGLADSGGKVELDRKFIQQLQAAGLGVGDLAKQLGVTPEKLKTMTLNAKDLGNAMQNALIAKGVGPLKMLGTTWATISEKVYDAFTGAFEDLGTIVQPFMTELQSLAGEFYSGSIASNDWGDAVKAVLTKVFAAAKEFVNFIHRGFLHAQIAMLQFRIAIAPVTSLLGELRAGAAASWVVMYLLKGTVIVLAIVFGILALAVLAVAVPFILVGVAILFIVRAVQYLAGVISGAVDNFDNLKNAAFEAGSGYITGLGNAIMSGAAWVVGLITGLAASMITAITGPLRIKSPSRVMMQVGAYTTEGLALGINAGVPDVQASARTAGMATINGVAQAGSPAASGGPGAHGGDDGRTTILRIDKLVIHGNGSPLEVTEEALALVLEKLKLQAGL